MHSEAFCGKSDIQLIEDKARDSDRHLVIWPNARSGDLFMFGLANHVVSGQVSSGQRSFSKNINRLHFADISKIYVYPVGPNHLRIIHGEWIRPRQLGRDDRSESANYFLPRQQGLFLNLAQRLLGGDGSFMVSVKDADCISGVNGQENSPTKFNERFNLVPPILFLCARNFVMGFGWLKLRCARSRYDAWLGISALLIGFPASVWGWVVFF